MLPLTPALLYAVWIGYMSGRASPQLPIYFPHVDKLGHVVLFGVLAGLTVWGLRRVLPGWPRRRMLMLAVLFTVLYGAVDEVHQMFVPARQSDVLDLLADLVGALLVVGWLSRPGTRERVPVAADR